MAIGALRRGTRSGAARVAVALLAIVLGVGASPGLGQARVEGARLRADLTDAGGNAAVRVEYVITGVGVGDSVSVTLLDFGLDVPTQLRVGAAGHPTAVPPALGAARRARLPVEAAPGDRVRLVVTYGVPLPEVGERGSGVARVPLLTVDAPPDAARAGLFEAEVLVPPTWAVTEAFPTGLVHGRGDGPLRARLPVVPSVITIRFRSGGARDVPLPLLVNVFAGACLALVGFAGWRQLSPRRA